MDAYSMQSSSSLYPRNNTKSIPPWPRSTHHIKCSTLRFKYFKKFCGHQHHVCSCKRQQQEKRTWIGQRLFVRKAKRGSLVELEDEEKKPLAKGVAEKKGTIASAVALIIGTSIGSGILALPIKASPAGIIPSSITMIFCWGFLLVEALLLIEINVGLRRKRRRRDQEEDELDVISIRTMAQETLGDCGGTLATVTYVFLGYTSMIAYASKSGEILFHLISFPESLSGCLFTALFTLLISIGGTAVTDQVNQCLTASMIGLLLAIEVIAVIYGGWSGMEGRGDWGKVPATVPVIIFSLVYHDMAPVLCAYLGNDLARLRASVFVGSLVPLLALLVWDAIALGLSAHTDEAVDPVELLMSVRWSGVSYVVEAFSLLAVGTSLIGTLLAFSEFFKEQLKNLSWCLSATETSKEPNKWSWLRNWWGRNKISFTAMGIVVAPTLLVSTTVPDAFSAATDIAGGYCMTMLYGVLPPAMARAMYDREMEDGNENMVWKARPALVGVAIFACGIVVEQVLQNLSALHL